MAFTANQLLTFNDLNTLVSTEGYRVKNSFTGSNELVTKAQIINALWLDGDPPLATYTATQLVRYADIAPLGTVWIGDNWYCVDIPVIPPPVNQPPTAPFIINTVISTTSLTFDWAASPGTDDEGIVGYVIHWARTSNSLFSSTDTGSNTNWTIYNLLPEEEYLIYVVAYDIEPLSSPNSNILTVTTSGSGGTPTFTDPYDLVRVCSSNENISISWQAATATVGISHYLVYYKATGGSFLNINVGNVTSTTLTGLSISEYEIYVVAVNNDSDVSGPTNTKYIDAISLSGTIYLGDTLRHTRGVNQQTTLTLDARDNAGDTYWTNFEWDQYPASNGTSYLTKEFNTSETITGRRGVGGSGFEFWDNFSFTICVLGSVSGGGLNIMGPLTFTDTTTSTVTLLWQSPVSFQDPVAHYRIEYKLASSGTWTIDPTTVAANLREYQVTGLSSTQEYNFRVRFYTTGAEYSNYAYTAVNTVDVVPEVCGGGGINSGGYADTSQIFDFAMSGTGTSFVSYFHPYTVPDRMRIYSGGVLIHDTKYIGSSKTANNDFYQDLIDVGVDPSDMNLGYTENNGEGHFSNLETIDSSKIIGGYIRVLIDAPLDGTGWTLEISCIN